MILTTQGIVLHTTKYAETSIIAKIFTRELGLRSYIIKGVRTPSGRSKQNMLQPLSHLDMTVYDNPKKQLQYVKEMRPAAHYNNIVGDSVKLSLLFFMDEVLYKSLREVEPNSKLFDFVVEQLQQLDNGTTTMKYFPIEFLLRTSRHLGIEPMDNFSPNEPLFNLKEGRFQAPHGRYTLASDPNRDYYLDAPQSNHLHSCIAGTLHRQPMPEMTLNQRASTLNNLLEYYHVHLSEFNNFKSHEVFHAVLR